MSTSDTALLEAWRAGDQRAGEQLFERYVVGVTRFFRTKVEDGVEDLVQNTFLGLVEGRDRMREASSIRSYLFAIAHNILRAHLRTLVRDRDRAIDQGSVSIAELAPGMSSVIGRRQEHQLLLRGLRRLPLRDQIMLELSLWEELSAAELAVVADRGSAPALCDRIAPEHLALHLPGAEGAAAARGAMIFAVARAVYLPLYLAAVPWLRSLSWTVGFVGLAMMALALV